MSVAALRNSALVLACLGGLALPLRGQAPATPAPGAGAYRIELDQLTGQVTVRTAAGRPVESWSRESREARAAVALVPAGRPVDVEVVNANPLLYQYDLKVTSVGRKPLPACRTLGSRLAATGALTTLALGSISPQSPLVQPTTQMFQTPIEPGTRGAAVVSTAAVEAALAAHGAAVARYARFLEAVRGLSTSLGDSLALLAELGESLPLDSLLASLEQSLERAAPGLNQAARVPLTVRDQYAAAQPHVAALAPYALAVRGGDFEGDAAAGAAAEVVRLFGRVEEGQRDLATTYRALQAQLLRVEQARARTRQRFSVEPSPDVRRLDLTVEARPEFQEVFRARVGRQEVFVEPSVSVLCQVSLGVGFMDRPPVYGISNGVLANTDDGQRTGVSIMLHLALSRMPWVGPLVGFGFGQDGVPDLYLGGSLRVLDPLMVNLGAVWQRTPRLPAGLALDQPVPDPSRLQNLTRRYAPAFFWGVSIAR